MGETQAERNIRLGIDPGGRNSGGSPSTQISPYPIYRNGDGPMSSGLQEKLGQNPFNPNSANREERNAASKWTRNRSKDVLDGRPDIPEFESVLGEDGGIKDAFKVGNILPKVGDIYNTDSMNQMRERAMADPGTSKWAELMKSNLNLDEQSQLMNTDKSRSGATATAMDAAAMRGGAGSGMMANMISDASNQGEIDKQGIRRGAMTGRTNIDIEDANRGTDLFKTYTGMDMTRASDLANKTYDAKKTDVGAGINEVLQKRAYNANTFNEQIRAWAAEKSSEAAAGGGKK